MSRPLAQLAALGRADVIKAAGELEGHIRKTPLMQSDVLDRMSGVKLWLKCENLQRTGSFKLRGATLAVARLSPEERQRGLVTYSSGNHAHAVACAAREYDVPATVVMPVDAPAVKIAAVQALGARVIQFGTTSAERRMVAERLVAENGGALIVSADDHDIIAGQGTATLELLEQLPQNEGIDALVVPVGGGGLAAGTALALEGTGIELHTVEPVGCDSLHQSLRAGKPQTVEPAQTLADGLRPVQVGERNFAILRDRVEESHTVDDEELGAAVVAALFYGKLLLEPSGAAPLALALRRAFFGRYRSVALVCSGGNIDPNTLAALLKRHSTARRRSGTAPKKSETARKKRR